MQSAMMILQQNPRLMATRLLDLCCGNSSEAMKTLIDGSTIFLAQSLMKSLAAKIGAISQEIATCKKTSQRCLQLLLHRGSTRKGANAKHETLFIGNLQGKRSGSTKGKQVNK